MKTRIALVLAAVACGALAGAVQQGQDVEVKTIKVAGPVHMLEGAGGNIGVSAGPDGVLMIDDQFERMSQKISAAVEALGSGRPKLLVNTHWHGDHTGGNKVFGKTASIFAHTNVRKRLAEGGRGSGPAPAEALPVVTYDDGLSIHFNGEEIKVVHFPKGHTDGDSVIFFTKSNVVHMGDHFFSGRFPFIDPGSGGDVAGYVRNVEKILSMVPADAKIIPGHGPLSSRADLEAFRDMLKETIGIVKARVADGKSLDEAKKAGLPEKWSGWSWGFISTDRWIETLYTSAAAAK